MDIFFFRCYIHTHNYYMRVMIKGRHFASIYGGFSSETKLKSLLLTRKSPSYCVCPHIYIHMIEKKNASLGGSWLFSPFPLPLLSLFTSLSTSSIPFFFELCYFLFFYYSFFYSFFFGLILNIQCLS